jgi:hypothetical protein
MSDSRVRSLVWSIALIGGGLVLLLFNFGVLDAFAPWPQVALAAIGVLAALGFFASFARSRQEWWRLIPAWTLVALSAIALISFVPGADPRWIAALVFVGLALGFGHIYLLARGDRWWAIIPGGFMLVLGLVVGLSSLITSLELLAALLFVGLGAVFFLLYLLGGKRRPWWALIPGGVLLVFGLLVLTAGRVEENTLLRWWPLVLIVVGLLAAFGVRRKPPPEKLMVETAPRAKPRNNEKEASTPTQSGARPETSAPSGRGVLGEYTQPAPGTSVEVLPEYDE